jgi:hypothetical protein
MVGCYEHDYEPSSSIKGGEFIDQLELELCSMELVKFETVHRKTKNH